MNLLKNNKKRVLSVFSLAMINIIAIDSLRNLPTNAANGLAIPLFYLVATLVFLIPSVLITAELATHHPKTGGAYVWVREAFGPRWGFITIWLQWIYNVFWYPTILSFIGANVAYLINPSLVNDKWFMLPMIIGTFTLVTIVNCCGMKLSSLISTISAVVGTIIPMLFIIALGVGWFLTGKPLAVAPTANHFMPHFAHIPNVAFLVVVFFSLMGMEMSAVHAEEVKNPQRDYPRALYYSSLIIVITSILASTAIAIVVPKNSLNIVSGLDQAFTIFFNAFHLKWLLPFVILIIILGGFGGMAAWVVGPPKGLAVAAQDGCAPQLFSRCNKHGVPTAVLIAQAVIVILLCSLFLFIKSFNTSYWILSDLTAQLALIFYIILFAAAIKLRYKQGLVKQNPQAFRIPGGRFGIWFVCGVGMAACCAAIAIGFIPPETIKISNIKNYEIMLVVGIVIFLVLPLIFYKFNTRKRQPLQGS